MGVYIKGMEMPTGNDELRLIIRSNGQVVISHKTHYEEAEAVSVPKHGRLIDADALKQHEVLLPMDGGRLLIVYASYVRNAPTIIPAEEDTP